MYFHIGSWLMCCIRYAIFSSCELYVVYFWRCLIVWVELVDVVFRKLSQLLSAVYIWSLCITGNCSYHCLLMVYSWSHQLQRACHVQMSDIEKTNIVPFFKASSQPKLTDVTHLWFNFQHLSSSMCRSFYHSLTFKRNYFSMVKIKNKKHFVQTSTYKLD